MRLPPVLLVSLDGVAPRFVTPERMPNLCGLVRAGTGCFTARTVDPPWTRPVHASMLRGVDAAGHGLIDNSMAPIVTDAPSVLAVARAAGRTTASVNNWRQLDTLIESGAVLHRLFIDSGYDPDEDERMVDLVEALVRSHRPDVMFVYLCRTDLAGHDHGWGSPEYLDAMTRIDATFGRLLEAAGDDASVVVTTDHGGQGTSHADTIDEVMDVFVAARSARLEPGSMWTEASMLDVAPTVADLAGLDPDPRWQGRTLVGREQPMVEHLLDLLRECDRHTYGEDVTMLEHALQSAAETEASGGDDELVVAALLHDIGHLDRFAPMTLAGSASTRAGEYGLIDHAERGARFLGPWLPSAVTEPIRLHVAAKRHLVGTDPAYADTLSEASRITLAQQGGAFTAAESAAFLARPNAQRAICLRRCDDLGKRPEIAAAPLDSHRDRLVRALSAPPIDPAWARDACRCSRCRDRESGQHLLDVGDLDGWTVLGSRRCADGVEVDLRRTDGERHTAWIPDRVPVTTRLSVPWADDYLPTPRDVGDTRAIAADVARDGLSLVRGVPVVDGEVLRFAATLGYVRETNYGRLFDVRVEPTASNLAYTPLGLPLHTDNPYRDPTPTVQVLHCLVPAVAGGATRLSDGFAAADLLRASDPSAFELLATTLVRFRFNTDDVDLAAERTVVELAADGSLRSVAVNHRSLDTPADTRYAGALAAFTALLDAGSIELSLAAGEAIVFDNRRVLHARTAYDAGSGRHLQGCYVDIDALHSSARLAPRGPVA